MVALLLNQYTLLVTSWLRGLRPMQMGTLHHLVIFCSYWDMIGLEMPMEYPKMMHFLFFVCLGFFFICVCVCV